MKRSIAMVFVILTALLVSVAPVAAATEHCPGEPGGNEFKFNVPEGGPYTTTFDIDGVEVNVEVDGPDVWFTDENGDPIVVDFCIKAGNLAGDVETGSEGTVTWLNTGGQTPDISYVVVYGFPEEPPEPILVAPAVSVTPPTCEADGTLVTETIEGVTYNVPAWAFGEEFTVTVTLDEGYALAEGASDSFTVTVLAQLTGEQCEEAPPTGGGTQPPPPVVTPPLVPDTALEAPVMFAGYALIAIMVLVMLALFTARTRRDRS